MDPGTPPIDSSAYVTSTGTPVKDFYLWVKSFADWFNGKSGSWQAYTPTVTANSGTLGAGATGQGFFYQIGKLVFVKVEVSIPTNGTGADAVNITLPINANVGSFARPGCAVGSGVENNGVGLVVYLTSANTARIRYYDSTYPGDSAPLDVSLFYEAA